MSEAGDKIIAGLQEAAIIAPYLATIERQREALRVAREAFTRPNLSCSEIMEDGTIHLRITERVWREALAAIDAALKEGGE